jgi:hypothetical protein
MDDEQRYKAAKKRVEDIREFYSHLTAYVSVNLFLAGLNIFLTGGFPWALIVMGGWGIGLAIHASETFGAFGLLGHDWEDRKMAQLLGEKQKRIASEDLFEEGIAD